jgi:hypothetical protein
VSARVGRVLTAFRGGWACLGLSVCVDVYLIFSQEKLEQLAARFDRKAGMRETWLSENQRLVSQDNFGTDLASVEAATKKHEAIETDIYAYEERVQAVVAVAAELEAENYHDIDRINERYEYFCPFYCRNYYLHH